MRRVSPPVKPQGDKKEKTEKHVNGRDEPGHDEAGTIGGGVVTAAGSPS